MRKYSARFGIGGGEGDLIADHTESWNSNVAQMVFYESIKIEKLSFAEA